MKLSLLLMCILLIVSSAFSAPVWFGNEHQEHLARKYLDADLAIIAEVISFLPRNIDESDSLGADGWTYHRIRKVVLCDAIVDSVLKGDYGDSIITFQSVPYTERSRSRLVRPSDSLYVMEITDNVWDHIPGRIFRLGRYILLFRIEDGVHECIYDSSCKQSIFDLFREVEEKGEDYFNDDERQRCPDKPEFGAIDIERLISDAEERARLEPLLEQYRLWFGLSGARHPSCYYGFRFSDTPVAGRQVRLSISAGPSYVPSGMTIAWVAMPPGIRVSAHELVRVTDVGAVSTEDILKRAANMDEAWLRIDELKNKATIRFDLEIEAEEGIHVIKVYFLGRGSTGRIHKWYEDYWVNVKQDTAEVSADEHFRKYPQPRKRWW
jgi:hypothetical protein